uniref:NR LBD domain-containing protein n=1 Tax=Meloidogyne hapla TaxID=6305 RepID=A0A1I8C3B5_MELHA
MSIIISILYRISKLRHKIFATAMEPFNRVLLNEEEFVLLRAIIYSHMFTNGVSKEGHKLLLEEAEKYSGILMKISQKKYGQMPGAKRYVDLMNIIETCFKCADKVCLFFNYLANVQDRGRFDKVIPEALADLCLRIKKCKIT